MTLETYIGVSHTAELAKKDEFRRNLRSHSWSVFSFFIKWQMNEQQLNLTFLQDHANEAERTMNNKVYIRIDYTLERLRHFLYTVGFRQSKTTLFDWTFFRPDFPNQSLLSSRVHSFCALPRGGWCEVVLLHSSRNRLAALCFVLSPRARARRTLVPASWWLRA